MNSHCLTSVLRWFILRTIMIKALFISFCILAGTSLPAYSASTIQVVSADEGTFVIQGVDLDGAAAFDLTLTYDTTALANPQVTQGELVAGAMMAVNPNIAGTIRMALIRTTPVTGTGLIATIRFERRNNSPGKLFTFQAKLANINGKSIPVVTRVINPSENTPGTQHQEQNIHQGSTTSSGTPVVQPLAPPGFLTSVTVPAPSPDQKEKTPSAERAADVPRDSPEVSGDVKTALQKKNDALSAHDQEKKIYTQDSVLERFRSFLGEKSIHSYTGLFDLESLIGFRQDPGIALSDGKTAVRVTFLSLSTVHAAPDVALISARLVSLNKDADNSNTWIAEIIPDRGTPAANLAVAQGTMNMVYPLTVAPKINIDLDGSGMVNEADFTLFLGDRGTLAKPLFDLNKDGKRDQLDDYIFTANFLASTAKQLTQEKSKKVQ